MSQIDVLINLVAENSAEHFSFSAILTKLKKSFKMMTRRQSDDCDGHPVSNFKHQLILDIWVSLTVVFYLLNLPFPFNVQALVWKGMNCRSFCHDSVVHGMPKIFPSLVERFPPNGWQICR